MEYITGLIFLLIGLIFGKLVLKQSSKNYDLNLFVLAIIFFIIGSKSVVFRSVNFEAMLSNTISPFLLGVLIRRYINKHLHIKDRS